MFEVALIDLIKKHKNEIIDAIIKIIEDDKKLRERLLVALMKK